MRSIEQLLRELQATEPSQIELEGELPPAAGASVELLAEIERERQRNPSYGAQCGPISIIISADEHRLLREAGAQVEAGAIEP